MATKKIRVEVEAPGADTAAEKLDGVAAAAGGLDTKQKQAADSSESLAQRQAAASLKAIEFSTKLAAAASAVQGLATALGAEGEAVGLIGKIAQSTAAGAQMGAMFGPQGALIGGVAGFAIPALQQLVTSLGDVADETAELESATAAAATTYSTLLSRMREVAAQAALEQRLVGGLASADEQAADTERLRAQERLQGARVNDLRRQLREAQGQSNSNPLFDNTADIADLTERLAEAQGLHATAANLAADAAQREAQARAEIAAISQEDAEAFTAPASAEAGARGGARRGVSPDAWLSRWADAMAEGERAAADASARMLDALMQADPADPLADLISSLAEVNALTAEQHELKIKGIAIAEAEAEAARVAGEEAEKSAAAQIEAGRAQAEMQMAAVQGIANGIGKAIAKVAETNATAEEGAKIALATTLEVIGQTAQMLAGMEFAKAIASYPDVAGMALHAAAGIAFTAVAIGTGEGAGALNRDVAASQAARAEKPEKPESGGAAAKSGGDVVVNIMSPIVTAQTHAELGRNIRNTLLVAERRAA